MAPAVVVAAFAVSAVLFVSVVLAALAALAAVLAVAVVKQMVAVAKSRRDTEAAVAAGDKPAPEILVAGTEAV